MFSEDFLGSWWVQKGKKGRIIAMCSRKYDAVKIAKAFNVKET